ncbi:MAG: sialidase family protein, partial [Actinomycetota bacterium]
PVPAGQTAPDPGTCRLGDYNANRSESWIAVKPGTEDLVGTSKVFFEKFSTFYDFHNGSYTISDGAAAGNNIIHGYECVSTGTQAMPPSWMNNTDPNVDFDTQGRAYQATLPFNPWWENFIHPDAAVGVSYSDDLGRTWVTGNGGNYLARVPNVSSKTFGQVEDKQWIAVNHFPGTAFQDHVYAMWSVFNGSTSQIWFSVSRDRGQTFSEPRRLTAPSAVGASNTYVYPSVDAAGNVYMAYVGYVDSPAARKQETIFVSRSTDDGVTWGPFVPVATVGTLDACCYPNIRARLGIIENFAASPTHPGHLYVTWENWDGTQMDVMFSQSTDGGATWSEPITVNDNVDGGTPTDQFQPSVAAGPGGAVAVAFYDRRVPCHADPAIVPEHVGRENFCIDVSLQAFRDDGGGAVAVGDNARITEFTWDPEQPDQTIDGIDQMACANHEDPCTTNAFIGDYFGLAISEENVYALFVSTHYPSTVVGDGGVPVLYQQQVLATVARPDLGLP